MHATRSRLVVALVAGLVVGGCAQSAVGSPAAAASHAPTSASATTNVPSPSVVPAPATPGPSEPAGRALPLLVDTDVAPDDLVALSFLLASPVVKVEAITVSGTGEAHCDGGVDVVLRLLERLQAPPIAVACGRETPMAGHHTFPDAWRESVDGGSGLDLPRTTRQPFAGDAVALIKATSDRVDGLRFLTLGPMTNVADALAMHPGLAKRVESVFVMGGALHVPGNVKFAGPPDNDVAEWNIYVDPAAAQAVIDSDVPVRLVSLDGTSQVPVMPAYGERVRKEATGPGARVLADLFAALPFMTDGSYYLWDPLAAAIAAGYPLGSFTDARVQVETAEGPESGFTRPVDGTPNVQYLSSADSSAAEDTLLDVLNQG